MRTYKFVDVDENPKYEPSKMMTIIDGKNLDYEIDGFETLNVSGREMIGREIQTKNYYSYNAGSNQRRNRNRNAQAGSNFIISSNLTSRVLTIEFILRSKTDRELRRNWEKMNHLVNKEEVELWFTDDSLYYYTGTLITVNEVNPSVRTSVSSFEYECMDPFKYYRVPQYFEFDTRGEFLQFSMYPVRCEELKVTPKRSTDKLRVENTSDGMFVQLNRSVNAGETVTFDFLNGQVRLGNRDVTKDLYLLSHLEDFEVLRDDLLVSNVPANCTLKFRRKVL